MINPRALEKALTLSTAHMPGTSPDFGGLRVVEHEYGYIIFVTLCPDGVPEWLTSIINAAIEHGCTLINFEQAADPIDGFVAHEW